MVVISANVTVLLVSVYYCDNNFTFSNFVFDSKTERERERKAGKNTFVFSIDCSSSCHPESASVRNAEGTFSLV